MQTSVFHTKSRYLIDNSKMKYLTKKKKDFKQI